MGEQLENLSVAIKEKNERDIIQILSAILSQDKEIELPNGSIPRSLITFKDDKIKHLFVEVAADLCKNEHNRKIFSDQEIVDFLCGLLYQEPDEPLTISTIRALGNICCENEEGRKFFGKEGLETVLKTLEGDKGRKNNMLTLKTSGFLVNLLMDNDDLLRAALHLRILEIIEVILKKYLKSFNENQMLFAFLLTVLNNVTYFLDEQNTAFPESLCCTVIEIFNKSATPDISVSCLEILHAQSDKDEMKMILARNGVCELVLDLIEKHKNDVNDEESRMVLRMACDMIVIILTGDDCMSLLYNDGNGKVYKHMVRWLDSPDPDLLSTGVLAIGNFARKDTHCIRMVQNGISKKLLSLLSKYNTTDGNVKVQHALLSTLKNLVIPQQNKAIVLQEGLIDIMYPMIKIDQHIVIFKLLGTFRMVIDGQEKAALDLISRKDFLERLVYWCYNSDHLGIRGEIPRLLAWLIKHCHSAKPYRTILEVKEAVKCLVELAASNHAVMQNESFYALSLLCVGGASDNLQQPLFEQLVAADIGKNLHFVVNKYSDKMDKPTVDNLLTLLEALLESPLVKQHLKSNQVQEALAKLGGNSGLSMLRERLDRVLESFDH